MRNAPKLYTLRELYSICAHSCEMVEYRPGLWAPARSLHLASLRERIRIAWLVFTGRADAVAWPEDFPTLGEGTPKPPSIWIPCGLRLTAEACILITALGEIPIPMSLIERFEHTPRGNVRAVLIPRWYAEEHDITDLESEET